MLPSRHCSSHGALSLLADPDRRLYRCVPDLLAVVDISSLLEGRGAGTMKPFIQYTISFDVTYKIGLFALDEGMVPA